MLKYTVLKLVSYSQSQSNDFRGQQWPLFLFFCRSSQWRYFRGTGGSGDASTDTYASEVALEARTASTKANEAAASATSAATAQAAAEVAQAAAETAQTNAETAETNAETAETNAVDCRERCGSSTNSWQQQPKLQQLTAQSAAEVAKTAS